MSRWNDPELEAAEKARRRRLSYRPWWIWGLQVLAGVLILVFGVLLVLKINGRTLDRTLNSEVLILGILLNIVATLLNARWGRRNPNGPAPALERRPS
jgi:hypothetical protein